MNLTKKTLVVLILLFVITLMGHTKGFAETVDTPKQNEENTQTLRVGYMDYHGFIDQEPDGTYSGYCVEYLNEISKYTGYQFEYVPGEWTELLSMLENKEIDILCNAQYTEERAKTFDYSMYPIGYTTGILYTHLHNNELYYEDFADFDGMTIGIVNNNAMFTIFHNYAKQNHFTYRMKEYKTEEELLNALNEGKIDAMCSEHLANHSDLSLLATFGADAYYIISYKDSPYLKQINYALQEIKIDVDFEPSLFHKYYDSSAAANNAQFTVEEMNYITSSDAIKVGLMRDRSPLSFQNKEGQAEGIVVALMDRISKISGLRFEYQFLDMGQRGYDFLEQTDGDLVAGVSVSEFSKLNPKLIQSEQMLDSSVVFVGRDGMNFDVNSDLIVALPSGFINGEQVVNAQYPNFKFYHGTSNEDCLKAIRDKKADVMLQNMYIIRECLQSPLYEGIAIFPAFSFPEEEKIIALPEDKLLMSIINKSIKMITQDETNDIVINHTIGKGYHADFKEILYKYRFPLIGVVILLIALFSLLIIISGIRQRNLKAIEKVNKKLETAVIQADRANNAKSQFLSRMSHEIRTPMNAIVGLTEIAKRYEEDPHKIDDYLDKISISSKVLLNIINDVLDMSAIENNKLKIINEEFDIKQILSSISTIYYAQCKSKEIHFDMIADIQNEYLRGDALRVSQILLNLVSNAYKFTKSGGKISIIIRETECHNEKAVLQFVVSDTGCGMTDDMKSRIFKPFEQESANTAKEHGGSGLGLSIAKNLISMMGGTISLESEKDKGTTFTVELTFAVVKPAEAEKNTSDEQKIADLHILVVDDDKKTSAYTSTILSRLGVSFETAQSGDEALSMLKTKRDEHPFSLCLINWEMADMNGAYVLKQIRDDQENEKMKVIILSYDANEIQDEAAGADCFVSKPLFQSTLQNALLTMMNSEYAENKTANTQYDFTGHRILLAEDQPLNAEIAIALLAMVNMESDHAENGRIAVRKFCDAPPGTYDVILMDMQMPELNGYEATKEIRALDRPDAKEIPIYAMTAEAFTEDIEAALKAGMNGHIAKPIDTKVLYETLKKEIILKDLHQKEGDL